MATVTVKMELRDAIRQAICNLCDVPGAHVDGWVRLSRLRWAVGKIVNLRNERADLLLPVVRAMVKDGELKSTREWENSFSVKLVK